MAEIIEAHGGSTSAPSAGSNKIIADADGRFYSVGANGLCTPMVTVAKANVLRTGGWWFAQRLNPNTPETLSALTSRITGPDGWRVTNETASVTYERVNVQNSPETGMGGPFYGAWRKITSAGKMLVTQCIEGIEASKLRGRQVRLQCRLKGTSSFIVRLGLIELTAGGTANSPPGTFVSAFNGNGTDPTLGSNLSYITPTATVEPDNAVIAGGAVECSVTTSWQRFGGVFTVPSDSKNLFFALWTGAQVGAASGFNVGEAGLYDGPEIQDWHPLHMAIELQKCQRYYFSSFGLDVKPAQNAGVATGPIRGIVGKAGATALGVQLHVPFPVCVRTGGTFTLFNPSGANAQVRTAGGDCTASAPANETSRSFDITATGNAGSAVGDAAQVHVTYDVEI